MSNTNTNETKTRRKHIAYQITARQFRENPSLTKNELVKLQTENYLKVCSEFCRPPKQTTIDQFPKEMKNLMKTYDPEKCKAYTDKQRARSLEVRREYHFILSERISELLEEKSDLTQREIAKILNTSASTVNRILKKK